MNFLEIPWIKKYSFTALLVVHFFGIIGIFSPYRDWFLSLTFLNLILSLVLLVFNSGEIKISLLVYLLIAFLVGFSSEVIGVNTHLLFGDYYYGENLGTKVAGVPLVIGINWAMLSYASGVLVHHYIKPLIPRIFIAGTGMVLLDFIIEPVAPLIDFWHFNGGLPGIRNYTDWFVIALFLQFILAKISPSKTNKLAGPLLALQAVFFGILFIFKSNL